MPLSASEYLFPNELTVTPTRLDKVLVLGACVALQIAHRCKSFTPEIHVDLVMFNNVANIPVLSREEASTYQFQYLSLPLREIITDRIINFSCFITEEGMEKFYLDAVLRLDEMFFSAIRHNREHGMLTFVANFLEPQAPVASSLTDYNSPSDLVSLIRILNQRLVDLIRGEENIYIADIESISKSMGKSSFQDDVVMFYSHAGYFADSFIHYDLMPEHNPAGQRIEAIPEIGSVYNLRDDEYYRAVWHQAEILYRIVQQIDVVKLVIFDLDDTLWRGQIAEHYGDDGVWPTHVGWPLGIWEAIHHLRSRGIMTGICSKNDEGLVRARWDRPMSVRWLTPDDFTFVEIGWRPKAEAIASMLQQANLTPKSVVFVDDNPVEREAVKTEMPEIRTIGSNPYTIRRTLLWSSETQVPFLTRESVNRHAMMQGQQKREVSRASRSREEFLADLDCKVVFSEITSTAGAMSARGIELLNKTNQFNTTGERVSHQRMVEFFKEGGKMYVFEVEDRFTKYGLVGVIRYNDRRFLQFAMSCRVIGLDIENSAIKYIMCKEEGEKFSADVKETGTNMVCRDVYAKCGFVETKPGEFNFDQPTADIATASHLKLSEVIDPELALDVSSL